MHKILPSIIPVTLLLLWRQLMQWLLSVPPPFHVRKLGRRLAMKELKECDSVTWWSLTASRYSPHWETWGRAEAFAATSTAVSHFPFKKQPWIKWESCCHSPQRLYQGELLHTCSNHLQSPLPTTDGIGNGSRLFLSFAVGHFLGFRHPHVPNHIYDWCCMHRGIHDVSSTAAKPPSVRNGGKVLPLTQ